MIKRVKILLFLIYTVSYNAQFLPSFTAFMETDMLYNPSVCGNEDFLSSAMGYRYQWTGVNGAPKYLIFSSALPTKNRSVGLGINFLNESIGPNSNNLINANFSYKFLLAQGVLSMGISGGLKNLNYSNDMIEVSNPLDPVFSSGNRSEFSPYFGFGASYVLNNLFFGIAIADVTNKNFTDDITLSFNYEYTINKELVLTSYFFYKNGQSRMGQMEMGCSLDYRRKIGLYTGFRTNQDLLIGLRLGITKQINLFYSYDYITKYYNGFTGGSHEFILRYNLIEEKKANNPRDF